MPIAGQVAEKYCGGGVIFSILSRAQLKTALGEEAKGEKARIIDVHIASLRKKLGPTRTIIKTVHSRGHRIAQ